MKKWLATLCLALGVLVANVSMAALALELTQGVNQAHPIAIDFAGAAPQGAGQQTIDQVITNDLNNSGQFRVVAANDATLSDLDAPLDYAAWQKLGVNEVLLGYIQAKMGGRYQLRVRLVDVYGKRDLLDRTYQLSQKQLRQVAHQVSDGVYQKITGTRGVFSTKLAYILVKGQGSAKRRYALEVSDADGFNAQTLLSSPEPIMSPAWAPDGRKLAYVSFENHRARIYLQDIYSGKRKVLSKEPGINGAPAFSPDGKKMALVLSITGNPKIYLMDRNSGRMQALTKGYSIDTEPNFSPDGQSILFTSNRGGSPQIYRYHLASKKVSRVTYDGNYNARGRFMPSEKNIVMLHRAEGLFGIAKQNLASGRVRVLTQANADESPSLSPNGQMVLYATRYGGRGVLAMVSTDGRIQLRLPAREGNVQEPAWSPFLSAA
jgi:TolB protein